MAISVVSFSFSRAAQSEARGPTLLGAGFLYRTLSLTHLISNSLSSCLPVFTELYNSSIAHSISLEWHVWSSSSGNNCHAGILPCPILSAKPAYTISSHNCCQNVSLPSGASLWNGMFGWVEGQYTTKGPDAILSTCKSHLIIIINHTDGTYSLDFLSLSLSLLQSVLIGHHF